MYLDVVLADVLQQAGSGLCHGVGDDVGSHFYNGHVAALHGEEHCGLGAGHAAARDDYLLAVERAAAENLDRGLDIVAVIEAGDGQEHGVAAGGEDDGVGLLGVDDLAGERGVETDLCAVLLQLIAEVEHEGRILGLSRRRHSGEPLAADLIAGFENGDLMAALRCAVCGDKYLLRVLDHGQVIDQLAAGVGVGDTVDGVADCGLTGAALVAADAVDYLIYLAGLCLVGQLGVGEGSARHDDKVGLLVTQHGLRHIDVVVAADGEHGDLDGLLDVSGVLGVVHHGDKARGDYRFLGGEHALSAVQSVNTGFFKHLCHDYGLGKLDAALDVITCVEAEDDRVISADGLADSGDDLKRKAHTVCKRAAVLVGALVGEGGHELIYKVAVCAVDLGAVKTTSLGSRGGFAEGLDQIMYLFDGQSAGNIRLGRLLQR